MAILIGKLRQLLDDPLLTHREFKKLEQTLFEGDGVITTLERDEFIPWILWPQAFQVLNFYDRLRFTALQNRFTLETYVASLAEVGLRPANSVSKLMKWSTRPGKDYLAQIKKVDYRSPTDFDLKFKYGCRKVFWKYHGETDIEQIEETEPLEDLTEYDNLDETGDDMLKSIDLSLSKHVNSTFGLPSNFFTNQENPKILEALKITWDAIPSYLRSKVGSQINFYTLNWGQQLRGYYNNHPCDNNPPQVILGSTKTNKNEIVIFDDYDQLTAAHTLLHEMGHRAFFNLDNQMGGNWNVSEDTEQTPGAFAKLVAQHYVNLFTDPEAILKFPTRYAITDYRDYFSEIFSIYYLGDLDLPLDGGYVTLHQGYANGFRKIKARWMQNDPKGYALMQKYDSWIKNGGDPKIIFAPENNRVA